MQQEQEKTKILVLTDDSDIDGEKSEQNEEEKIEDYDVIIDARTGKSEKTEEKGEEKQNSSSSGESEESKSGENESGEESHATSDSSNSPGQGGSTESSAGSGAGINSKPKEPTEDDLKSHTDEAYNRNQNKLYSQENATMSYASVPKFNTNRIYDYKKLYTDYVEEGYNVATKHFNKYKTEANKVVSYLVKEFELRKNADQSKRAKTSKTGELNMSKIYSYKFSEDIFKKSMIIPGGKSHGLILFLDWSGSMCEHISNTVKQLVNLTLFCKKVNIPFEVYSFIEESGDKRKYFFQTDGKNSFSTRSCRTPRKTSIRL